jgi:CheY-like chemotaxis protein
MARPIIVPLAREEEITLRRVAQGATGDARSLARLKQLALVEPWRRGWRLTPLGQRRLRELPTAPLMAGRVASPLDSILDRFIPMARAAGLAQPDEPAGEAGEAAASNNRAARRILVAEDCYVVADAVTRLLRGSGYDVVGPAGRLEAAEQLAATQPLDGALLDIKLADELSFPLAMQLQERHVPVAFVSGYAPSIVPPSPSLRAIPFIAKPFEDRQLVATVKAFAP